MTLRQIAELFPVEYRKEMVDLEIIQHAQAVHSDNNMHYLFTLWEAYVEPGLKMDCGLCITRVLDNFKKLLPELQKMEREHSLLASV